MKKLTISIISVFVTMMIFSSGVFAMEIEKNETEEMFSQALEKYEERIENGENPEIKYGTLKNADGTVEYKVKMLPVNNQELQATSTLTNQTVTYVAYLTDEYMEMIPREGVQPYAYNDVWDSTGGVLAYLTLNINGGLNYGYIYSISGGWSIADGAIQVANRKVEAWTGAQRMTQWPEGLSYSYLTGFTYQSNCGGYSTCTLIRGSSNWDLSLFI